ncbi:MAG: FlgD immunoglobulin-like domain containing protein [Candidatus Latescibacterota bacterium]|jgi:hypothetical protein
MSNIYFTAFVSLFFCITSTRADELVFDSAEEWSTWQKPSGLTHIGERGQLQLIKFRKNINAVQDANLFSHETKQRGDSVSGGVWAAGSNPQTAALAIDGDLTTFWQPDPNAALEDWSLTIDLGRAVLAREIRLTFPDQPGAQPLRQFTVLVNAGVRVVATQDVFLYRSAYRTTRPNTATTLSIPLQFPSNDSTLVLDSDLPLEADYRNQYQLIQYINIMAEEQNLGGAIAEVEVIGIGDNIAIGTEERGEFTNGANATSTVKLFDANLNTNNSISSGSGNLGWKEGGVFFTVDLGAVFFVDEIFIYSMRQQEGTLGFGVGGTGPGHTILFSDGTRTLGSGLPGEDSFDFSELLTHLDPSGDDLYYIRYLFKPRKMRYLFWHGISDQGWGQTKWGEFMLFSPGYPAQVLLRSDFIDLGGRAGDNLPKVIKALNWDAELPPNTRLRLRSRSGNQLQELYIFYDKKGDIVNETKYNSSPKVLRGPIDTLLAPGEDWSPWSNQYRVSGEPFKSESPRRYLQLEMIIETEDPAVAPTVNSLSIKFEAALVQEAKGRIEPQEALANEATRFTYDLSTRARPTDNGFDLLRFVLPEPLELDTDIELYASGERIDPMAIEVRQDTLLVTLPQVITTDSLAISFTTRIVHNATLFALDLGMSQRPGLWQSVEAVTRRANIVILPALVASQRLIHNLEIIPPTCTPNGDGINDQLEIRFAVLKVDAPAPQVQILDLSGRLVTQLESGATSSLRSYVWDGRDAQGKVVPPGIYLCRIDLGAQTGEDEAVRLLGVAY